MNTSASIRLLSLALPLLAVVACDSPESDVLAPDAPSLVGKADGAATIEVTDVGDQQQVVFSGQAAIELADALVGAGHPVVENEGVLQVAGEFTACARNSKAAACAVLANAILPSSALFTIWERPGNAASEIFEAFEASGAATTERGGETQMFSWSWDCGVSGNSALCAAVDGRDLAAEFSVLFRAAPEGFIYEVWIDTNEGAVSMGRFDGNPMQDSANPQNALRTAFRVTDVDAEIGRAATGMFVTLEPTEGDDGEPGEVLASGMFEGATVNLVSADGTRSGGSATWK